MIRKVCILSLWAEPKKSAIICMFNAADGKLIVVDCGYGFFNDDFPWAWSLGFASPEALEGEIDNI